MRLSGNENLRAEDLPNGQRELSVIGYFQTVPGVGDRPESSAGASRKATTMSTSGFSRTTSLVTASRTLSMSSSDSVGSSKNDTITNTRRPALRTRTHSTPLRWKCSATAAADSSTALTAPAYGLASTRSPMLSRRMSYGFLRKNSDNTRHTAGSM